MSRDYESKLDPTEIDFAVGDPLHEEADLARADYTPVDHFSHLLGIGIATFYPVAALITLHEVIARYGFNAPTCWAFEVVMVLCAACWMLSSGYLTLRKRHIGITVIHSIATPRQRWWLDLFAMLVGIAALHMVLTDAVVRASAAIGSVERSGTAFNAPLPLMMKSLMAAGGFLYLVQLMMNLHRHFETPAMRHAVRRRWRFAWGSVCSPRCLPMASTFPSSRRSPRSSAASARHSTPRRRSTCAPTTSAPSRSQWWCA